MPRDQETTQDSWEDAPGPPPPPAPGAVLVSCDGLPALVPLRLENEELILGRDRLEARGLGDESISRQHARIAIGPTGWRIRDLGSRNGTFVDTQPVQTETVFGTATILRLGRSLFLLVRDVRRFEQSTVSVRENLVVGPTLGEALQRVASVAARARTVLLVGESGSGKEVAARHFHAASVRPGGPFVAVNCAAIPEGVAERLLFGAIRGAYSGANVYGQGYLEAADGGTLFLDEVGDLDPAVQGKLLRAVDSGEILPLGAAEPRLVEVRVCCATHRDLRADVVAGRFREDLYFRISNPEVRIPPLRERLEEIPWLLGLALQSPPRGLAVHGSFVEACCLRPWPGNVRELLGEVQSASERAIAAGRAALHASDLSPTAGLRMAPPPGGPAAPSPEARQEAADEPPQRRAIEEALRLEKGNVAGAARLLGMHRTQLRRWIARYALDPKSFADDTGDGGEPR